MNNNQPIRDARQLGLPKMLILGLQHMFAMFGATVLVPILVRGYGLPLSIQTTLLFAGIGTLFFHVCTRLRVPAFLGSSFAFLGGFQAIANLDSGKYAAMEASEKLQYACGGIVVAGLLYVILAGVIKLVGVKKLTLKEFELLWYLWINRNRVVTREELLDHVWSYEYAGETRTLDMHVRTLRQKLGEEGASYVTTVRGIGYRLEAG